MSLDFHPDYTNRHYTVKEYNSRLKKLGLDDNKGEKRFHYRKGKVRFEKLGLRTKLTYQEEKAEYQLLKFLDYGARRGFFKNEKVAHSLTSLRVKLQEDSSKWGTTLETITQIMRNETAPEHKHHIRPMVQSYYERHKSKIQPSLWKRLLAIFSSIPSAATVKMRNCGEAIVRDLSKAQEKDYPKSILYSVGSTLGEKNPEAYPPSVKELTKKNEEMMLRGLMKLETEIEKQPDSKVNPHAIYADMICALKVDDESPVLILSQDELLAEMKAELDNMTHLTKVEHGHTHHLKRKETEQIYEEVKALSALYKKSYPEKSWQEVFQVVRDCSRAIVFQVIRDRSVFCGSDHGVLHILKSIEMEETLLKGIPDATVKDRLLCHIGTIYHDIGYTLSVSQSSFGAAKDHPLFGARFIEVNQGYFDHYFGQAEREALFDVILYHSYPKDEFGINKKASFNPALVRTLTSTVDALGATFDTKMQTLWRDPQAVKVLQKVKLRCEMMLEYSERPNWFKDYQEELKAVVKEKYAKKPHFFKSFNNAIEHSFNTMTTKTTFQQYAGIIQNIEMVKHPREKDKNVPRITLGVSQTAVVLSSLFGNEAALAAFEKIMVDFGISDAKATIKKFGEILRVMRDIKVEMETATGRTKRTLQQKYKELEASLTVQNEAAIFVISPTIQEPKGDIIKLFEDLHEASFRPVTNQIVKNIKALNAQAFTKDAVHEICATAVIERAKSHATQKQLEDLAEFCDRVNKLMDQDLSKDEFLELIVSFVSSSEMAFLES